MCIKYTFEESNREIYPLECQVVGRHRVVTAPSQQMHDQLCIIKDTSSRLR